MFDLDSKRLRLEELQALTTEPGFWDDRQKAESSQREIKASKAIIDAYDAQLRKLNDAVVLLELAEEAQDAGSALEAQAAAEEVKKTLDDLEFRRMLSGEHDGGGAVLQINSGAGGVDAADWAQMLLRMLLRYADRKGWKVEILDEQPAEEAGIKSATLVVTGDYAYGLLKAEMGVHRLVRISPFDGNARRQTSFAAVTVSPDIDDTVVVDINESDLRIDYYRAGGAGGQHVNKTDSAVRITHLPTNIVVQCQNERSQHKNKSQAMRVLRARLHDYFTQQREAEAAQSAPEKKKIEWGSQIRSYVLAPYRQVTDHRTDLKIGNVDAVLDGDLDSLIRTYLLGAGASA
ncbi:MAG TPA: peptide chain release factor 2 [Haliangium sp.]|nr:peptide chain release factor 2 [Haliangium sp.]